MTKPCVAKCRMFGERLWRFLNDSSFAAMLSKTETVTPFPLSNLHMSSISFFVEGIGPHFPLSFSDRKASFGSISVPLYSSYAELASAIASMLSSYFMLPYNADDRYVPLSEALTSLMFAVEDTRHIVYLSFNIDPASFRSTSKFMFDKYPVGE